MRDKRRGPVRPVGTAAAERSVRLLLTLLSLSFVLASSRSAPRQLASGAPAAPTLAAPAPPPPLAPLATTTCLISFALRALPASAANCSAFVQAAVALVTPRTVNVTAVPFDTALTLGLVPFAPISAAAAAQLRASLPSAVASDVGRTTGGITTADVTVAVTPAALNITGACPRPRPLVHAAAAARALGAPS